MVETWKDVKGYEGIYQVSDLGNVRSLDRFITNTNGVGFRKIKGVCLKLTTNNSGYKCITLHKKGIIKTVTVHRLMALHFIPNPDNLTDINHKDENKSNNTISNLEWVSHEYNMNYGERNKKASKKLKGTRTFGDAGNATQVICIDTGKVFDSITRASLLCNCNASGISQCCRKISKTCGSYRWMYYTDYLDMITRREVAI